MVTTWLNKLVEKNVPAGGVCAGGRTAARGTGRAADGAAGNGVIARPSKVVTQVAFSTSLVQVISRMAPLADIEVEDVNE